MDISNLIATEDQASACGTITYWNCGGKIAHDRICEILAKHGIKQTPGKVGAKTALHRVLTTQVASETVLVRKLASGKYLVVQETQVGEEQMEWKPTATVGLTKSPTGWELEVKAGNLVDSETFEGLKAKITRAFNTQRVMLDASDVTYWMVGVVKKHLDAVTLRDNGGVYFVPKEHHKALQALRDALDEAKVSLVRQIPAMRATDAAVAILAALQEEAFREAQAIEQFLTDNSEAGKKALRTKESVLEQVKAKVQRYEQLFGARAIEVQNRLAAVRAKVAQAMIVAEAGAEGREISGDRGLLELNDAPTVAPAPGEDDMAAAGNRFANLEMDGAVEPTTPTQLTIEQVAKAFGPAPHPAELRKAQPKTTVVEEEDAITNRFAGIELD